MKHEQRITFYLFIMMKCVFGSAVEKIDSSINDFDRIDFD
jgi:hypothetical protein